jgi:ubiquinone/menaquinone biosynthesis C-methylase UbiE
MPVEEKTDNARAQQQDCSHQDAVYVHGYASMMTEHFHATRTAQTHAAFFLPYLQSRPAGSRKLLDCGCGSGGITVGLAAVVAPDQVTGIDIAASEIERARERAAGLINVNFAVEDIRVLPYPDNSFDAIFAHNMLEHLLDPDQALREMQRVLKPDGLIGIRDIDFGGHILATTDPLLEQFHALFEADWRQAGGHPRIGRMLRAYLHRAGFVDIQATASYEPFGEGESVRWWSRISSRRCTEPDFVARVTGQGMTTLATLEQMRLAYTAWGEQTESFFALAHGEAVARKS